MDASAADKFEAARVGISRLERLHPYAAHLVSLHYASFQAAPLEFRRLEARRRRSLMVELADRFPGQDRVERDLALLQFFDLLSLYVCLTPPDASQEARPTWLTGPLMVPGLGSAVPTWLGPDRLGLDPSPFGQGWVALTLPYRDLPAQTFATANELDQAWDEAADGEWSPKVGGGRPRG